MRWQQISDCSSNRAAVTMLSIPRISVVKLSLLSQEEAAPAKNK